MGFGTTDSYLTNYVTAGSYRLRAVSLNTRTPPPQLATALLNQCAAFFDKTFAIYGNGWLKPLTAVYGNGQVKTLDTRLWKWLDRDINHLWKRQ
jgi:hypothetical protein